MRKNFQGGPIYVSEWRGRATKAPVHEAFARLGEGVTLMLTNAINFTLRREGLMGEHEEFTVGLGSVSIVAGELKRATLEVSYQYQAPSGSRGGTPAFLIDLLNRRIQPLAQGIHPQIFPLTGLSDDRSGLFTEANMLLIQLIGERGFHPELFTNYLRVRKQED